jgi:uncharacterized protein YndB with AHSA1/START domain
MTTKTERVSDLELRVTRDFDATPDRVYAAWTTPALMQRWWVPESFGMTMLSCEIDARTGGSYRFVFSHPAFDQPMAFFGRYIAAIPGEKLVWTNEESPDGSVTTVTLTDLGGRTRLVLSDVHASKDALDATVEQGGPDAYPEQFAALDRALADA